MPDLDELQLVLMGTQRLEDSIDTVAGKSKNSVYTPLD